MNLKLHIIASSVILILLACALVFYNSSPLNTGGEPPSITEDRFVQIKSATWGQNCNGFLKDMQEQARKNNKPSTLPLVRQDNALRVVSTLCNGKESCSFSLTEQAMGFDPAPSCAKTIEVEYRCFLTDLPHKISSEYSKSVYIDCE